MTTNEYIQSEQEWLRDNSDRYKEAVSHMSDQFYVRGLLRGIEDKLVPILAYNPNEQPAHAAVFAAGAVQAKLEGLLTDLDFIDEYEDRRKDLVEAINNAEPQGDGSRSGQPVDPGQL